MGTQGGNNEFIGPGDKDIGKSGDQGDISGLQDAARGGAEQVAQLDSARANCIAKCGPMENWMSTKDPGFEQAQKEKIAKMTPEERQTALKENEAGMKAIQTFMASLENKIKAVNKTAADDEKMRLLNRMA